MTIKVKEKLRSSLNCFGCGKDNPYGIKGEFYGLEDGSIAGLYRLNEYHQGYVNWCHGGIIAAALDEAIAHAVEYTWENAMGITAKLDIEYKRPVPYDEPWTAYAKIAGTDEKYIYGKSVIVLANGKIAAIANGVFVKHKYSEDMLALADDIFPIPVHDDDPTEFEVPEIDWSSQKKTKTSVSC